MSLEINQLILAFLNSGNCDEVNVISQCLVEFSVAKVQENNRNLTCMQTFKDPVFSHQAGLMNRLGKKDLMIKTAISCRQIEE